MTVTTSLDDPSLALLTRADPALASLPDALAAARPGWRLHDVRWTPGRGCRLAYLVEEPFSAVSFVAVHVGPTGWSQHDYREDPLLPGLVTATQDTVVSEGLGPVLGAPVQVVSVIPVRYRPGSRCVLRYELFTGTGAATVYAKVVPAAGYQEQSRVLTALSAAPRKSRLVPELVALWPESHAMLSLNVPGRALSTVLGDPSVEAVARVRLAHRLGDVVARFHSQTGITARTWTTEHQCAYLSQAIAVVRVVDEVSWQRLRQVLDLLAVGQPENDTLAPAHGSLRAGQAVVGSDGHIVLLDTDRVALCQRERDLGSALAHLTWQAVRQPTQAAVLRRAAEELVLGYERRAGHLRQERLAWWHAASLVQLAARRYRRLDVGDWPALPELVRVAEETAGARAVTPSARPAIDLRDPQDLEGALRAALGVTDGPGHVLVGPVAELGSAAGRRTSVQYLLRRSPSDQPLAVVGKAFADAGRASLLYAQLRLLHSGPFGSGALRVPEPIALLDDHRMVLYRAFDGVPLNRLGAQTAVESGVLAAARWLATLHGSGLTLPRRFSLEQEERSVRQWAELVARVDLSSADLARGLASDWGCAAEGAPWLQVPIHKDFHPGHVLVGEGVCVIDLDEARLGDPALDLAHFAAYLSLDFGPGAAALQALFLDEYAALNGRPDARALQVFTAYTWLKIAKQWAVGSGPGRSATPGCRAAGLRAALERAAACLSV